MQESEFDKQVQRELQGLRLRPSEAVWENVEKELRRKKKRRIIVAFWLLAGISLLGYTGYLLTQKKDTRFAHSSIGNKGGSKQPSATGTGTTVTTNTENTDNTYTQDQQDNQHNPSGSDKTSVATPNAAASGNSSEEKQTASGNTPTADKQSSTVKANTSAPGIKTTTDGKRISDRKRNTSSGNKAGGSTVTGSAFTSGKRSKQKAITTQGDHLPSGNNRLTGTKDPAQQDLASASASGDAAGVKAQQPLTEATAADTVASKADTAIAKAEEKPAEPVRPPVSKKKTSSKIKWSLDLAAGLSGPISSPFLLGGGGPEKVAMDLNAFPNQGGIWAPVTPPFGQVYVPRSDINPGPAVRVGVLAELPLSKRISINSGLQYQYQSNNIRIGYYKDTAIQFSNYASQMVSVRAVYQGTQQKTFTNRFHYIQVPVNLNWQLNKGDKLPIVLNTGLTMGYLISTNGLLYDSLQGGIYYHDKSAFNKFQLSLNTGLSFRFGNKRAIQWSIGPDFSMGLGKMVKVEYDKKQYPLFIGLQGRIYLPGRKR